MTKSIRIILVEPSHPGNIGAAARAMKTMGLSRLVLVKPAQYPSAEATSRAAGADDVLADAAVVDTLDEALNGCTHVYGTSARLRSLHWPVLDPRESASKLVDAVSQNEQAAVVFGRERTGLNNEELSRCHYLLNIPSNPEYSSLNLAAAVQLVSYEIRMATGVKVSPQPSEENEPAAPAELMAQFYQHLEQALIAVNYMDPDNPRYLMRRLRRLFNRAQPNINEVNILRGILKSAINTAKSTSRDSDSV